MKTIKILYIFIFASILILVSGYSTEAVGSWEPAPSLSTLRHDVAVTVDNLGLIYAIGGWYDPNTMHNTVEVFNEYTQTWQTGLIPNMIERRSNAKAVTDSQGRIWVVGGGPGGPTTLDTVERYDPATGQWELLNSRLNSPRAGMGIAIANDDSIYVFGGNNASGTLNTAEKYDPNLDAWVPIAAMNQARYDMGDAMDSQGLIYAIGGGTASADIWTVERYDPSTNLWTHVAPLPDVYGNSLSAFALDGEIWAVGGWHNSMTNESRIYNPDSNSWRQGPMMYEGLVGAGAVVSATGIPYVIGGQRSAGVGSDHVARLVSNAVFPNSYDFGSVNVGSSSTAQTFKITNISNSNFVINTIGITGTDSASFVKKNDYCISELLVPEEYCTVQVVFKPASYGSKSAYLRITSDVPYTWVVPLYGTGGPTGTSTFKGTVYSQTGSTISGVSVDVGTYSATTNSSGQYSISDIPSGSYIATVSKSGYATLYQTVSIPPASSVTKDFLLTPLSGTITINNISSKYSGHVFYLDGTSHNVDFTANVDWAGHPPEKVRFITPNGTYDVSTSGNTASIEFDMGTEFGTCGELRAIAISSDTSTSDEKEADFTVMSEVFLLPDFRTIDIGDGFYYDASVGKEFSIFDEKVNPGVIPDYIPLFGGKEFSLQFAPSVTIEVTSDGAADYSLELSVGGKVPNVPVYGVMADISFSLTPQLELEGNFSGTACIWDWDGYVGISGSVGLEKTWPYKVDIPYIGKIGCYLKAGINVSGSGNVGILDIDPLNYNGRFNVNPEVTGSAGADITKKINVTGWITGGADYQLQWPQTPTHDLTIYLTGGITASAFTFDWETGLLNWDYNLYQSQVGSMNADQIRAITPKLISRDYLKHPDYGKFLKGRKYQSMTGMHEGIPYTTAIAPLQSVVFPYSESDLSSSGNNLYLAWLYDNPERATINRTMVVFSLWNGIEWSEPIPIADDGTADFHPQILTLGDGTAFAVWENINQVMPDTATFDDMVRNLEISASIYDPLTNQWSYQNLFTANSYLDASPEIAGKTTDNVLLVWVSNEANDLLGSATNPNKLYYSKWNGSSWSAPQLIVQIPYGIIKYDLVYNGQNGYVVMSLDTDNDLSTIDDHELYTIAYNGNWGALTALTSDSVADDNPQTAIDPNENFVLTWLKGGELSSVLNFNINNRSIVWTDEYSSNLADFKFASTTDGKLSIVYAKPSEYSSDLWAMFYDPIFSVWGSPKQLTFDTETERQIKAGFYGTDTLIAVYDRTVLEQTQLTRTALNGKTVSFTIPKPGTTDLYMMKYTMGGDLAIETDSLDAVPSNPAPGETATLKATIMNMGDMAVNNVSVAFYNGDPTAGGIEIGRTTIADTLAPGDSIEASVSWTVPSTTEPLTIYAVVDPDMAFEDINRINNVINKQFIKPDLIIQTVNWNRITDNLISITARITNQGSIASGGTIVKFRKDSSTGDLLSSQAISSLAKDQSMDVNFVYDVTGLSTSQYVIAISIDEENVIAEFDENNNTRTLNIPSAYPDADNDGYTSNVDCDDSDANVHPGAAESCNGIDDNCDGVVPANEADTDSDGYRVCAGDCDDSNPAINPGATEVCDGIDNDCDGQIDEGDVCVPDLVISTISIPSSASAGQVISISDTTKNQGTGSAGASTTKFYLSTDTTLNKGDTYLGSRRVSALAVGALSSGRIRVTIPTGTSAGTYYIITVADANKVIVESNEKNNNRSRSITITSP